jgi:ribonuclease HI
VLNSPISKGEINFSPKEITMLNISTEALAKRILNHIRAELSAMQDLGDLQFKNTLQDRSSTFESWKITIQKMIEEAAFGVTYKAFFDGGATPNPGDMKIGGYIETPTGKRIFSYSVDKGYGTNNEAEYLSLIHLVEALVNRGVWKVRIHGDSNLVVNQVKGKWKAREPRMKVLRDSARESLQKINDWNLVHIPRNKNKGADALT